MALGAVKTTAEVPSSPARHRRRTYAVRRTVPPSAEIEARIDELLAVGVGENPRESLSELAKLGARLIIQRAVEDECAVEGLTLNRLSVDRLRVRPSTLTQG
jgi:hypothetical protein